jgi:transposase
MGKRFDRRAVAKYFYKRGVRNAFHLAKVAHIPKSTAYRYYARLARSESLDDRPRSGRPTKITSQLRRQLGQVKAKHPEEDAAFYARELSRLNPSRVSESTVRTVLKQLDYGWRLVPRKRLTPAQRSQRVAFAQAHLADSWNRRWSFDEAYFNLYRHSNRRWVRCKTNDAASHQGRAKLTAAQEKVSVGIAVAISREKNQLSPSFPRIGRVRTWWPFSIGKFIRVWDGRAAAATSTNS